MAAAMIGGVAARARSQGGPSYRIRSAGGPTDVGEVAEKRGRLRSTREGAGDEEACAWSQIACAVDQL